MTQLNNRSIIYVWCFFLFSLSVVNAINNHSVRCDRLDERESSALCDGYHEYKTLIYDKVSLWPDMWWSPVFKADNRLSRSLTLRDTGHMMNRERHSLYKMKKKLLQSFLWHLQPSRGVKKRLKKCITLLPHCNTWFWLFICSISLSIFV